MEGLLDEGTHSRGVAAGTKAAAKLKREMPDAQVTILTRGKDISYAGCGLPYYVGGAIASRAALVVNSPEQFSGLTGAKVLTGREAYKVEPEARAVWARRPRYRRGRALWNTTN